MNLLYKDFSHITYQYKEINPFIEKILKGEKYVSDWQGYMPEEDIVKRGLFGIEYKCVAKGDRWRVGRHWFKSVEEVSKDYDETVIYDKHTDTWYYKPWLAIHMKNGKKYTKYFDSDESLDEIINFYKNEKYKLVESVLPN